MEFQINGESMIPLLQPCTQVRLDAIKISEVKLGDMIAYYNKNTREMIVHRVVKRSKWGLVIKGDNNWKNDIFRIKDEKLLIVREIRTDNKTLIINSLLGKVLNIMLLIFSVLRIIPLLTGRQFFNKIKINGKKISKSTYIRYTKSLENDINNLLESVKKSE
jgi:Peptidase S24-like.